MKCDGIFCRWVFYDEPQCVHCAPKVVAPRRRAEEVNPKPKERKRPRIKERK